MKALVLEQYNNLVYQEIPDPEIKANEVLIRVKSCGICGSDVHGMDGSTGRRIPPIVMGHEAAGIIEKTGSEVNSWKTGDRVTFDSTIYPLDDWFTRKGQYNLSEGRKVIGVSCEEYRQNGAFAEFIPVPEHILSIVPEGVTFDQASMTEPVSVALHSINLSKINFNDTIVVVGTGVIGLCIIQGLRARGCGNILGVDPDSYRLNLAHELGADMVFAPDDEKISDYINDITQGRGADCGIDAVGIESSLNLLLENTRKGGTVTLVGNISPHAEIPFQDIVTREIRLQGSCAICGEYPSALNLIQQGKVNVDKLISATAPLSEGAHWFKKLYNKEDNLIKVILNPE